MLHVRSKKILKYQSPLLRLLLQVRLLKYLGPKRTFIIVLQVPRRCFCSFAASKTFLFPLTLCGGQTQSSFSLRAKETCLCGSIMNICPGDCTGWLLVPSAYVISSFCLTDQFVQWWCLEPCSDDFSKSTVLGLGLRSRQSKMASVFQQRVSLASKYSELEFTVKESPPLSFVLTHSQSTSPRAYFAITK